MVHGIQLTPRGVARGACSFLATLPHSHYVRIIPNGGVVERRRDVSAQGPCLHTLQHSVLSTEAHLSANKQTPPRLSVSTIKRFMVSVGRDLPPAPAPAPTRAVHLHTGSLVFLGPCDVQYFRRCDGEIGLITAEQSLRRPDLRL